MSRLYLTLAPLPSEGKIPALRAELMSAFPSEQSRRYIESLTEGHAHALPPRVSVARLAALSLLPKLLSEAHMDPSPLRLLRDGVGRPYAMMDGGRAGFDFNLSHTDTHVACALLTGSGRVGVDVQTVLPSARAEPLIRRYCTDGEHALLRKLPTSERHAEFTRIWTVREAMAKQDGGGAPLRFDASVCPDGLSLRSFRTEDAACILTLCCPDGIRDEELCISSASQILTPI